MESQLLTNVHTHVTELFTKLPSQMVYHNYGHTRHVVSVVEELCEALNLPAGETEALVIAAWFHDVGYILNHVAHEDRGIEMANDFLLKEGVKPTVITQVAGCIKATQMPTNPKNLFEQIMCDADVSYVGTNRFIELSENLRLEWEYCLDKTYTRAEWVQSNLAFLQNQRFYTAIAESLYGKGKEENIRELQLMVT